MRCIHQKQTIQQPRPTQVRTSTIISKDIGLVTTPCQGRAFWQARSRRESDRRFELYDHDGARSRLRQKTRNSRSRFVIPNEERELTQGCESHFGLRVLKSAWAKSFAALRMTIQRRREELVRCVAAIKFLVGALFYAVASNLPGPPRHCRAVF